MLSLCIPNSFEMKYLSNCKTPSLSFYFSTGFRLANFLNLSIFGASRIQVQADTFFSLDDLI